MEKLNIKPAQETGIDVDAVRRYMLSQDESLLEVMEKLKSNPDRLDLDKVSNK